MEGYGGHTGGSAWDYSRLAPAGEFSGEQPWNANANANAEPESNSRAPPPGAAAATVAGGAAAASWNPGQSISGVNASGAGTGPSTGAGTTGDGGHKPSSSLDRAEYSSPQQEGGDYNHNKGFKTCSPEPEEEQAGVAMVARGNPSWDPEKEPKVEEMNEAAPPAAAPGAPEPRDVKPPGKVRDVERHHHHHQHHHHKRDREGNPKHEEEDRKPPPPPPGPGASRGARSRLRAKERDGWHGRVESAVTYKIGEAITEITKLWKESNSEGGGGGGAPLTLDVRVAADLATTSNRQVRGSQLWGTDVYTEDSDVVAVLMHTGYYSPTASPPPSCISEIRATLRILPPQSSYKSTLRNSVRSRAWGAVSECSYSIERCRIVKSGGGVVDLESSVTRIPVVAPTLAPAAMERAMTTRSASSTAHRQQRFVQEVTIQYNLCNEPWFKYSMSIVADRGLKKSLYTSARLKKGDVLYLETHRNRYELSYDGEKGACNGTTTTTTAGVGAAGAGAGAAAAGGGSTTAVITTATSAAAAQALEKKSSGEKHNGAFEKNGQSGEYSEHYKWARCNAPLPLSLVKTKGVPLPPDCVEVLEDGLGWEEVQWSPTSVWIRGKEFVLARAQFLSPRVEVLVP